MESFVQIIQLFRWPITVIILACIFKRPLSDLIPNSLLKKSSNYGIIYSSEEQDNPDEED